MKPCYRFRFNASLDSKEIEDALFWAVFNAESCFGKAKVRLDSSFEFDRCKNVCVIDSATPVGRHIAQVFTALSGKKFGETSFKVERLGRKSSHANS